MTRKIICIVTCLILALSLLSACTSDGVWEHSFFALDTVITLKCSKESAEKIEEIIREYESILSPTLAESELYKLNNNLQQHLSPKFREVFDAAYNMSEKTDGAYNFAIYPLILKWGFTTKNYAVPTHEDIKEISPKINFKNLKIKDNKLLAERGAMMDFGGIAKGFICDKAVTLLKSEGEKNALLSLGGNVYALGNKQGKKWEIAIKNPFSDDFAGILSAENRAVVTSGAYERYFEENGKLYHHIIDPKTGYPAENDLASVTIVSESATLADGYSTALFVMGFEKSCDFYRKHKDFDAIFILKNGKIYVTEAIAKDFTAEKFEIIR